MLQNEIGTCFSENTHYDAKKHADLKTCHTSYATEIFFKFLLYLNPKRRDRTPQCIALRSSICNDWLYLIEYKNAQLDLLYSHRFMFIIPLLHLCVCYTCHRAIRLRLFCHIRLFYTNLWYWLDIREIE